MNKFSDVTYFKDSSILEQSLCYVRRTDKCVESGISLIINGGGEEIILERNEIEELLKALQLLEEQLHYVYK